MERCGVVAGDANVAADDAGSGSTAIDLDDITREALLHCLVPYTSGASTQEAVTGSIAACRNAWKTAGQLPARQAAMAIEASNAVWPDGVPDDVKQTVAWAAAETAAAQGTQHAGG